MTILQADLQLNPLDRPPTPNVYVLGPARPTLVIETNNRATSLSIPNGSLEAQPIDAYGTLTGAPVQLAPGSPLALGTSARWRLVWDGGLNGSSAPLQFI